MYLLFDIGGTNTRLAISADGQTLQNNENFPTSQNFESGMQNIKLAVEKLSQGTKIEAAAGGIAGILDPSKSILLKSPNLPGWSGKNLRVSLEQILQTQVKLENDVALGGLGEASFGKFDGHKIIAFVAIGTGVGGVRIVDGRIDRSAQGFEIGHQIIVPDGKPCHCGGKGHLEAYVAGAYLQDPINWEEVTNYLAIGLNNTIVHWSPDIVILGGGVGKNVPLDSLKVKLSSILTIFPVSPEIVYESLGDERGLYGALKLL